MIRYPAELEEHWDAAGEHLTIRPVRPDDVGRERADTVGEVGCLFVYGFIERRNATCLR